MKYEIKGRFSGSVMFAVEAGSLRIALEMAVKSRADLSGADLYGANLYGANLYGADLSRANLYGANLYGEKLTKTPIQILGLRWPVLILERQIKIGCEIHDAKDWGKFKDSRISKMGSDALAWWKINKKIILDLHKAHIGA